MELITELFDEDTTLPITNLNPKKKIPQIFSVHADDAVEQPGFRLCTYTSGGDTNRDLKPGDKMMHIVPFTLSAKGSIGRLKSVGSSPINYINAVFTTAFQTMKQYKIDACMLRILKSKTAGQARQLQVIAERLVRSRAGGRYVVLRELWDYDKKYAYILIHRKNIALEDIPGVPEISTELFTKVESKVGDVYVEIKTGTQVTKNTAIAASIAAENDKRSDQAVVAKIKISRRAVAQSQSVETNRFEGELFQKYESTAAELNKPVTAELIPEAAEIELALNSKAAKLKVAERISRWVDDAFKLDFKISSKSEVIDTNFITTKLVKAIGDNNLTSVESIKAYTEVMIDEFDSRKEYWLKKFNKDHAILPQEQRDLLEASTWNALRAKFIKREVQSFAQAASSSLSSITMARSPEGFTAGEKRGIMEYCGSGYIDINNMLLGRYSPESREVMDEDEIKTAIAGLDSAFNKGNKLPEGITLYRAQTMKAPIFDAMVKNKVFYFRNFVSTSLSPIIFGQFKATAAIGFAPDEVRVELNVDKTDDGLNVGTVTRESPELYENIRVKIGWAIDGASKINVVYPGDLSLHSNEMEVILPRGLMVKVNKITDSSYNDGVNFSNNKFIQSEILTTSELQESVVYDGDALMETGELVALSGETESADFASFVSSDVKSKAESALGIIASCVDIKDTPYKFVQG